MSPSQSIVFSPEVDERQLDREVSQINEELEGVGQIDVQADGPDLGTPEAGGDGGGDAVATALDAAMLAVQERTLSWQKESAKEGALLNDTIDRGVNHLQTIASQLPAGQQQSALPSGGPELGTPEATLGDGGRGQLGAIAGGVGGLASKIPASTGAIAAGASAAMPIAIAGAVGVGILKGIAGSSAALSSVNSMFGTAVDIFFRPFGDWIASIFRPMAKDMIGFASDFSDIADSKGLAVAVASLPGMAVEANINALGDIPKGEFGAGDLLTITASTWAAVKLINLTSMAVGAGSLISIGSATSVGASALITIGSTITAGAASLIALGKTMTVGAASLIGIGTAMTVGAAALIGIGAVMTLDALELIDVGAAIDADWDDVITLEGSVTFDVGKRVAVKGENNPLRSDDTDVTDPSLETGVIDPRNVPGLKQAFEAGQATDEQLDKAEGWIENNIPGLQTGGRITQSGVAEVHRGEMIADPDRLISDLSSAIQGVAGGGGDSGASGDDSNVDMQKTNDKLDRLHRDLRNLRRAFAVTLNVDGETLARTSENNRQEGLLDTDPTTG